MDAHRPAENVAPKPLGSLLEPGAVPEGRQPPPTFCHIDAHKFRTVGGRDGVLVIFTLRTAGPDGFDGEFTAIADGASMPDYPTPTTTPISWRVARPSATGKGARRARRCGTRGQDRARSAGMTSAAN
ncbi:MAG TPA: hypothetical protein VHU88_20585 [Sporichthyaceae bacterium]|nr:hypothetical protein [Sporichthyaceae bacterium]